MPMARVVFATHKRVMFAGLGALQVEKSKTRKKREKETERAEQLGIEPPQRKTPKVC